MDMFIIVGLMKAFVFMTLYLYTFQWLSPTTIVYKSRTINNVEFLHRKQKIVPKKYHFYIVRKIKTECSSGLIQSTELGLLIGPPGGERARPSGSPFHPLEALSAGLIL